MDPQIPDKLYFKIGEVARLTGVKPHVLRYWEAEIGSLRPNKSRSKQRLYRKQDIEKILYLKDLLYNQGFTIAGARKQLRHRPSETPPTSQPASVQSDDQLLLAFPPGLDRELLAEIRRDLLRLKNSLAKQP